MIAFDEGERNPNLMGSVGAMGYLSCAFCRREKPRFFVVPNLRHFE